MARVAALPVLIKAELHLMPDGSARYRVASGPAWPTVGGQRCLVGGYASAPAYDVPRDRLILAAQRALDEVVNTLVSQRDWLDGTEPLPIGSLDHVRGGTARFF